MKSKEDPQIVAAIQDLQFQALQEVIKERADKAYQEIAKVIVDGSFTFFFILLEKPYEATPFLLLAVVHGVRGVRKLSSVSSFLKDQMDDKQ